MLKNKGFTLIEILVALTIFTIISMILVSALHNMINISARTEARAERLRDLQMALLMFSRDIEQSVDRPIINAGGKEDPAFIGSNKSVTFTHMGFADPFGSMAVHSALERTRYFFAEGALRKETWPVLDQASNTKPHQRVILKKLKEVRFEYIDQSGRIHADWPLEGQSAEPLPRAVRLYLTFLNDEKMSQLYVIPAESAKAQPVSSSAR